MSEKLKISICTINGGGGETMVRLWDSMKLLFPHLQDYDWQWNILVQGNKGINNTYISRIKNSDSKRINILKYPRNLGTVWAWNELIDYSHEQGFDVLWMVDDDMQILDTRVFDMLLKPLQNGTHVTSAERCAWFGPDENLSEEYNTVCDHGSGCTMYALEVFVQCGYHNEELIQYAHDSEFNNRIRIAFGDKCLSVLKPAMVKHYNQTGTFNCFDRKDWEYSVHRDSEFLKNIKYTDEPFLDRLVINGDPLYSRSGLVRIF